MYKGISLVSAEQVTMRDNILLENVYNFNVDMYSAYAAPVDSVLFEHDIDTSNTVEGKEIHYYVDQNDLTLNQITVPNIGFLAVVNAQNIDFYSSEFSADIDALAKDNVYLVYCRYGGRSGQAVDMMADLGFVEVYDLDGGFLAFSQLDSAATLLAARTNN